jgi:hypothetical protein
MTHTNTGFCLAAAMAFAASLAAQTPQTYPDQTRASSSDRDAISVTGCLERDAGGSFVLANAHVDTQGGTGSTSMTGTTASGTTSSGTTSGTAAGSAAGTTGVGATSMSVGSEKFKLEGTAADLDKHVGHKIQVTGREVKSSASTTGTSTTGTTGTTATTGEAQQSHASEPTRQLDVKSVKMISSSCS